MIPILFLLRAVFDLKFIPVKVSVFQKDSQIFIFAGRGSDVELVLTDPAHHSLVLDFLCVDLHPFAIEIRALKELSYSFQ